MKIKAVIAPGNGDEFLYSDVEVDNPRADEILVKIEAVRLCHTDVLAQHGVFQFGTAAVLGHEGAGIIERIGRDITKVKVGDRVCLSFRSCGTCRKCKSKQPASCQDFSPLNISGGRVDGSKALRHNGQDIASNFFGQSSFATHALTYEQNVVKISDDIPFEIAAPLGCGVQTGAGAIMNSLDCEAGASLVVAGCGVVGLSGVMAGKIRDCSSIVVIEPVAVRRELALELGATHVIDPLAEGDIAEQLKDIFPLGVNYALDTSARADVLEALLGSLAVKGELGLVGMINPDADFNCSGAALMAKGLSVHAIIEGDSHPDSFIPELITHFKAGRLPLDRLITTYPLKDINTAIKDHSEGTCTKVVLIP
ncbi:MAG: NAD(P)-dependent alcohol dehydrogenase [Litorimonas sp.]